MRAPAKRGESSEWKSILRGLPVFENESQVTNGSVEVDRLVCYWLILRSIDWINISIVVVFREIDCGATSSFFVA